MTVDRVPPPGRPARLAGSVSLGFRSTFHVERLKWCRGRGLPPDVCGYCGAAVAECPMQLWRNDGASVALCDECVRDALEVKRR